MAPVSCQRFQSEKGRLWLSVIAYNPGHLWRWLAPPPSIEHRWPTRLQRELVRTGSPPPKHARYY